MHPMKTILPLVFWLAPAIALSPRICAGETPPSGEADKCRVLVLTDISNEPDDEESLVRFLVYANEYDVEGLVATTSTWLRSKPREDLIRRQLAAYGQVRDNLLRHSPGFPTEEQLASVVATGQSQYGMAAVGEGQATTGSRLLLAAADKADGRPLWISVWGGANTLAQALFDARRERSAAALETLVAKLRVYTISDQDDAGPWLRREFPSLFYIVSPSTTDWKEYWRATWTGISGDRHYRNGPGHQFHLVDNPWLEEHVIDGHGPLGALYPKLAYIMEGDTPSFLGLVQNGLSWHLSPAHGGWGGRYQLYQAYGEAHPIWTNNQDSRDTVTADNGQTATSDPATIWRWREHFQHDFAARMDWCVTDDFRKANHNPIAILNGDTTRTRCSLRPSRATRCGYPLHRPTIRMVRRSKCGGGFTKKPARCATQKDAAFPKTSGWRRSLVQPPRWMYRPWPSRKRSMSFSKSRTTAHPAFSPIAGRSSTYGHEAGGEHGVGESAEVVAERDHRG